MNDDKKYIVVPQPATIWWLIQQSIIRNMYKSIHIEPKPDKNVEKRDA